MKTKLFVAGIMLTLCTTFGVSQYRSFAANVTPENVKTKYIDGWRAHEHGTFKINKVNHDILVEGGNSNSNQFTTFVQSVTPHADTKRFLLSADIRSENLDGWAGLWMRIDGPDKKPLGFDNMQDRPITGTQPWKPYKVVLDVSPTAKSIVFGFLLSGKGKAWVRNLSFKPINTEEPVTDQLLNKQEPQNLEMK